MSDSWQVTASIRVEGKLDCRFRETAINEAESIINGALKNIDWLQVVDKPMITATRRIYEV